jgi:hypothetical protein
MIRGMHIGGYTRHRCSAGERLGKGEAVADAHRKDEEIQDQYGVKYLRYWFNEKTGEVFCLADAPNKEAAEAVHREAHGLMADEITEVEEGAV